MTNMYTKLSRLTLVTALFVALLPTANTFSFRPRSSLASPSSNLSHAALFVASDAVSSDAAGDDGKVDAGSTPLLPPAISGADIGGDATVTQLIFNLVKGIVGAGVLSLPAGIAAFGSAPSAVIPAVALISIIGGLSGYSFALIGRCCAYTNTKSYREAWAATISPSTSWIPATAVTFKTMCAALAYSMILSDTFMSLFSTAGIAATKIPVTIGLTSIILLPLCLLKNLSSLAPFSLVGSLGMAYTAIAMTVRFLGKAYVTPGGKFATDLAPSFRPQFGTVGVKGVFTPSSAILVSMLSTAYMAHFMAPKIYTELKEKTLPNYYKVVSTSFTISVFIFALMTSVGYLTFGSHSSGLILNNYSTRDGLMGLSRLAIAVSLVFSYPLIFGGARDGMLDLLKLDGTDKTKNILTLAMLSVITVGALIIPDVTFVLALAGATLGNGLIYIFPALMFRGAIKKKTDATVGQKREVKLALGSALAGLIMGVMGAKMALASLSL